MSSIPVSLPAVVPSASGSPDVISSTTPPVSSIESGAEMINGFEHQLAPCPDAFSVPRIQPPPEPHTLHVQRPTPTQPESQVFYGPVTEDQSHQPLSGLSAAGGSNTTEPLTAPSLDNGQRCTSMQPPGQGNPIHAALDEQLPELDFLMSRMTDNQNDVAAVLSGVRDKADISALFRNQQTLSQHRDLSLPPSTSAQGGLKGSVREICSPQPLSSGTTLFERITPDSSQMCAAVDQHLKLNCSSDTGHGESVQSLSVGPQDACSQPMLQQGGLSVDEGGLSSGIDVPTLPVEHIRHVPVDSGAPFLARIQNPPAYLYQQAMSQHQPRQLTQQFIDSTPEFSQPGSIHTAVNQIPSSQHFISQSGDPLLFPGHCVDPRNPGGQPSSQGVSSRQPVSDHLSQQSTQFGPPPGLSPLGGYVWPPFGGEQPSHIQNVQPNVFERFAFTDDSTAVPFNGQWSESHSARVSEGNTNSSISNEGQVNQPVNQVLSSSSAMTNSRRMPVFGFSSISEAESFEPAAPRSSYGRNALGFPSNVGSSSQQNEHLGAAHIGVKFGFPSFVAAMSYDDSTVSPRFPPGITSGMGDQMKVERLSQSPFVGHQGFDGNIEFSSSSAQVWGKFVPREVSSFNVQDTAGPGALVKTDDGGFARTCLGGPSTQLEPGEILDPNRYTNAKGSLGEVHSHGPGSPTDQLRIGILAVEILTNHQVLFIFQVIAMMANLQPAFTFKYGGEGGKKIGVKLTMWGHTVTIAPSFDSTTAAKVAACRRGIQQLQDDNPMWLVPPQPIDGATTPAWNWNWMLDDYCAQQGWPQPLYRPSCTGSLWYCDIFVKDKVFRTVRECRSLAEVQNTAAHISIHQLMVVDSNNSYPDSFANLPTTSTMAAATGAAAPVGLSIEKQCAALLRSGITINPKKSNRSQQFAGVGKGTSNKANPRTSTRKGKKKSRAKKSQAPCPPATALSRPPATAPGRLPADVPSLPPPAAPGRLPADVPSLPPPAAPGRLPADVPSRPPPPPSPPRMEASSANYIPLANSRLAPIREVDKPPEDPLAKLKSIEKEIKLMSSGASFRRMMETLCTALGINNPSITRKKTPENDHPHVYDMFATFDNSHPYLHRASPIMLATVKGPDTEVADEIAVKHVILNVLQMVREDADISEAEYKCQLRALYDLESETQKRLDSQSKASGSCW